jgi:hypothetical protein
VRQDEAQGAGKLFADFVAATGWADVAAPLNGTSVRNAALTAGSYAEPSAVAKKFRIERFASWVCAAISAHTMAATKSANVVPAPCASSCRTERIPRTLFWRSYSGAPRPVDRNLMLDRLTDNLDIRRNPAGNPALAQEQETARVCGATGSKPWLQKQSALSESAAWVDRWPDD